MFNDDVDNGDDIDSVDDVDADVYDVKIWLYRWMMYFNVNITKTGFLGRQSL